MSAAVTPFTQVGVAKQSGDTLKERRRDRRRDKKERRRDRRRH